MQLPVQVTSVNGEIRYLLLLLELIQNSLSVSVTLSLWQSHSLWVRVWHWQLQSESSWSWLSDRMSL